MKKFLITALAAAALSMPGVYADSQAEEVVQIVACYDENGKLVFADRVRPDDESSVPEQYQNSGTIKFFELMVKAEQAPAPTSTPQAPEATQEPTAVPEATLHPAYEKEADAVSAFAVVEKVVTTVNTDNEEIYAITCLYQGKEITVEVAQDIIIKSAPTAFDELTGADALSLEKGDAIYFETNIAGNRVRGIYLIHRPTDVFDSGSEFYTYFTSANKAGGLWSVMPYGGKEPSGRYAYAFGVVVEKYDNTMVLYPKSGLADEAIDIDFTNNTVVYTCDMEGKPELEISRPAGIKKSRISKTGIDDDENITYSDDYTYSLALVRLVDDVAADIVVYQNLEF